MCMFMCSLTKDNYEVVLHELLKAAKVLDQTKDPCSDNFIPNTKVVDMVCVVWVCLGEGWG